MLYIPPHIKYVFILFIVSIFKWALVFILIRHYRKHVKHSHYTNKKTESLHNCQEHTPAYILVPGMENQGFLIRKKMQDNCILAELKPVVLP